MTPAALVLAGSRGGPDAVAEAEGVAHKVLAEVGGVPILTHVIEALRAAGVTRIAVSADHPQVAGLAATLGAEVFAPEAGPSASVASAFAELGAPLLLTTGDHALLQPQWIRDFIGDTPAGSDVSVLLAERVLVEEAMPGSRRTWLHFADGDWSGCNLFLLATPRAVTALDTWRAVEADRKRPWRIAMRLGPVTLARYLMGRLTLRGAVGQLGRRVGITASAVAARNGLAAVDVDKMQDLDDVRRIVGG